ncbi:MAG: DUF402 domain-containing protein [Anaerolineae bacterium]
MIVYKLDEHGRTVWQYPAAVLAWLADGVRLEAFFDRDDMDLGFVWFRRGDRFMETFYSDRWYNVFAVYEGADGRLKGWYCNVCRPAVITETAVRCEDLALDVWVNPDGSHLILDEDEFAALALTAAERNQAGAAVAELLDLAQKGELPR